MVLAAGLRPPAPRVKEIEGEKARTGWPKSLQGLSLDPGSVQCMAAEAALHGSLPADPTRRRRRKLLPPPRRGLRQLVGGGARSNHAVARLHSSAPLACNDKGRDAADGEGSANAGSNANTDSGLLGEAGSARGQLRQDSDSHASDVPLVEEGGVKHGRGVAEGSSSVIDPGRRPVSGCLDHDVRDNGSLRDVDHLGKGRQGICGRRCWS
jgi:hypothetical protein